MTKRPTSVSVIGWILIAIAIITLLSAVFTIGNHEVERMMRMNPLPIGLQYIMMMAGLAVALSCGIGLLKGQAWARLLYTGWGTLSIIIGFATSPMKGSMIPGTIFFIVMVFFLFRPKVTVYLTGAVPVEGEVSDQSDEHASVESDAQDQ